MGARHSYAVLCPLVEQEDGLHPVPDELAGRQLGRPCFSVAEAAGVMLGDIVKIDYSWGELEIVSRPVERCMMSAANGTADSYKMDIEPDDIDVTDTVTVVWEIG